jgi:hypothetical protein
MKVNFKHYAERGLNALAATMLIAAAVHMIISISATMISRNIFYINPVEFLGLGFIYPRYLHSAQATAGAWGLLIAMFSLFFVLHAYLFVSITPKPNRISQYVIRIGRGANQILRQAGRQMRESQRSDSE